MRWMRRPREEPHIDVTNLTDVLLLLLIFFMVSTTFEHQAQLSIELPKAQTSTRPPQDRKVEVEIDEQGRYYVNDRRVVNAQLATLEEAIRRAVGDDKGIPFIISADGRTPHQAVVTAMDAARQIGITHLAIATRTHRSEAQ